MADFVWEVPWFAFGSQACKTLYFSSLHHVVPQDPMSLSSYILVQYMSLSGPCMALPYHVLIVSWHCSFALQLSCSLHFWSFCLIIIFFSFSHHRTVLTVIHCIVIACFWAIVNMYINYLPWFCCCNDWNWMHFSIMVCFCMGVVFILLWLMVKIS